MVTALSRTIIKYGTLGAEIIVMGHLEEEGNPTELTTFYKKRTAGLSMIGCSRGIQGGFQVPDSLSSIHVDDVQVGKVLEDPDSWFDDWAVSIAELKEGLGHGLS